MNKYDKFEELDDIKKEKNNIDVSKKTEKIEDKNEKFNLLKIWKI